MPEFERYPQEIEAIATEVERQCVALGLDCNDELQLRALAREALRPELRDAVLHAARHGERLALSKSELFGLSALMLKVMEETADIGFVTHGNDAWKHWARALWAEKAALEGEAKPSAPATGARQGK